MRFGRAKSLQRRGKGSSPRMVANSKGYAELSRLLDRSEMEIVHDYDRYFYEYYSKTVFGSPARVGGEGLDAYCRLMTYFAGLVDLVGQKVIDYGCGHGLTSIFFGIFGARKVLGVDINAKKIQIFQKILTEVDEIRNVSCKQVAGLLDGVQADSYDRVFLRETISHAPSLEGVLAESHRVLKAGGRIVIVDENNALSPKLAAHVRENQEKIEEGPVDLGTAGLLLSYREMRQEILGQEFPDLPEETLSAVSEETKGLHGTQLVATVEEYLRTGRLRNPQRDEFRNPLTGEYPERLFNPYRLAEVLRTMGFYRIFVQPGLPFHPTRRWIRYLASPFFPIIFRYSQRGFEITAVKR